MHRFGNVQKIKSTTQKGGSLKDMLMSHLFPYQKEGRIYRNIYEEALKDFVKLPVEFPL